MGKAKRTASKCVVSLPSENSAPFTLLIVAYQEVVATIRSGSQCATHLELSIRNPTGDITWIFSHEGNFTTGQVEMVDIVHLWVLFIHDNEQLVWEMFIVIENMYL